jgi:hypothetical protein
MLRAGVRVLLVAMIVLIDADAGALERRGSVAFHYGRALTQEQLDFFGRFDVLVTHDPLPAMQVAELHRRGTRLALYEWTVAFYATLATPWQRRTLGSRMLLNRKPLRGGAGALDADAFYYDPAAPGFARRRTQAIRERLRTAGYDGVFFDTTTEQSVHPDALQEFRRRHPVEIYDAAVARFLSALRAEVPLILTNQGFRAAEHYLPFADYDVTESLITRPSAASDGGFVMREWRDERDPWNSIEVIFRELIRPAASRFPTVRFVHLNYIDEVDAGRVEEIVDLARCAGQDAYVVLPDVTRTIVHDVYFRAGSARPCPPVLP